MSHSKIHPTAIIDASVKMGKDVTVGPYVIIGPDVTLGERCHVMSHAVLEYVELGADCVVYPHTSLGFSPQHLKYKGEKTKAIVGSRCVFREGVTVHRGTMLDQGTTLIEDDCYFMALSHVAHDCRISHHVVVANAAQLAGHVYVGHHTFISSMAAVHQFVRIGSGAMLSGGAMIPLDVAPYCVAQGDRASIRGLNIVGMRRMGFDRNTIRLIKEAYQTVFESGLTLDDALKEPALHHNNEALNVFKEFFKVPKRGFLRPRGMNKTDASPEEILA